MTADKEPVRALASALMLKTGRCPLCDQVEHLPGCAVLRALHWVTDVEVTLARHVVPDDILTMAKQAVSDRESLLRRVRPPLPPLRGRA